MPQRHDWFVANVIRGKHMIRQHPHSRSQSDQHRAPRAEPLFKPVALPAVAAAVHAARPQPQPRREPAQDLPPFLRKDSLAD